MMKSKKLALLPVFALLLSSLTMLKAQPPAGLTQDQWKVFLASIAHASRAIEAEKKPLGKLLTEAAHKDVRPLIIEYVANAPTFLDAAKQIIPLALTSKDMMEESIKGLVKRIERDAEANQKSVKDYATERLYELSKSEKPVPAIAFEAFKGAGADINAKGPFGYTPLHRAAQKNNKKIVDALIKANADVNAKDQFGDTPLHEAARAAHKEIAQQLLNAGADVNAKDQDQDGYTPLHWAALKSHKEIVDALIKANADVNAKDRFGDTSLHKAALKGHKEIVQQLLNAGADKTIKDYNGQTAYDYATDPEIKRLLEQQM